MRNKTSPPVFRKLRGYAFDPSLSMQLDTAVINNMVFKVPWEDSLEPGPVGEYVEIIDYDPASQCFYDPVDLNHPYTLAQDGLEPSENNPHFHQQMVYAVVMTTISNFENALGRRSFWSPNRKDADGKWYNDAESFVQRLRIYPHALREANAYYSPAKKALLFGYFPVTADTTAGMVFSCLSHDIIAHETTHALLDGMNRRIVEPTHPDSLAFHEAFADIVALLQHFSFPEVLRHQIARTRGNLSSQNLLGELAQQFGRALGQHGALRSAIGRYRDDNGLWEMMPPDPAGYRSIQEPHERGAILVAAIFEAFISVYNLRVNDLLRISSNGTGILAEGALHPDLVNRLAGEAAKSAQHILGMCIRGLDYCPPVDITFGDYLRAIISVDTDLVPDDDKFYRIALTDAFRRRGIYPEQVRSLSLSSIRWESLDVDVATLPQALTEEVANMVSARYSGNPTRQKAGVTVPITLSSILKAFYDKSHYLANRQEDFLHSAEYQVNLHKIFKNMTMKSDKQGVMDMEILTGLCFSKSRGLQLGIRPDEDGMPVFEVHLLRSAQRIGPEGSILNQLLLMLTQQRYVKTAEGREVLFRGGCTMIIDLDTMTIKHSIKKLIDDPARLKRQLEFQGSGSARTSFNAPYFRDVPGENGEQEPFALLHRHL